MTQRMASGPVAPQQPRTVSRPAEPAFKFPGQDYDFSQYSSPESLAQLAQQQRDVWSQSNIGKQPGNAMMANKFTPENAIANARSNLRSGKSVTGGLTPEAANAVRQQVTYEMNQQGTPYLGVGTWTPQGNYTPGEQEQWFESLQKNPLGLIRPHDFAADGDLKNQIQKQALNFQVTPEQIRAMNNRPDLYNQFQGKVADFKPTMQARYDEILPKKQAAEAARAQAYRDRMNAMRYPRKQSGGGFSLGNLWQAVNPFAPISNIATGKGSVQDYINVATMFL
jgi:hypothetical protein